MTPADLLLYAAGIAAPVLLVVLLVSARTQRRERERAAAERTGPADREPDRRG